MLASDILSRIERLVGATIESYRPVGGGYSPATRLLCRTASASFFVKAGSTPLTSEFLRREMRMYNTICGSFMPRVIAMEDDQITPILVIEDLSTHAWPPPWNERRIELVLEQIDTMHRTAVTIETFAHAHGSPFGWQTVAADPAPFLSIGITDAHWLDAALMSLIGAEQACSTEGTSLTHWDLRSDNICFSPSQAIFVDWNWACLSNPRLDLGFWLPSLAYEGGPQPERILPNAPEVAAWVAGFFAARAGLPNIPDAPRVRLVQRQQLEIALPWAARELGLPSVERRA